MMLSRACEYGMRAALYLATLDQEGYVSIREISEKLDISFPFLTKIFQKLTQAGLMQSSRGPSGGVSFTRPPGRIALLEIVIAIDGPELFTECVLGLPGCGVAKPCPLHARWAAERDRLEALFRNTTLADMASRVHELDVRLTARTA